MEASKVSILYIYIDNNNNNNNNNIYSIYNYKKNWTAKNLHLNIIYFIF